MNNQITKETENNSVTNIQINVDGLDNEVKKDYLLLCCQKLAMGGNLVINGVHLPSFCKEFLFSNVFNLASILNLKSVTKLEELVNLLKQNHIKIQSVNVKNSIYTIQGTK